MAGLMVGGVPDGRAADPYPGQTLATYQVEMSTLALADNIGRKISQVQSVFNSVQVLLSATSDDEQVHRALNRIIKGIGFLRAAIILQDDGTLLYDSSALPASKMNLSDRQYFQKSMQAPLGEVWIGTPVFGRSSSLPFIPMTTRITTPLGDRVVVAIVVADPMIDPAFRCQSCSVAVVGGQGDVLASAPAGYQPPSTLVGTMITEQHTAPSSVRINMMQFTTDWRTVIPGKLYVLFSSYAP